MPEFSITASFEIWCEKCGAALCANVKEIRKSTRSNQGYSIKPCEDCLSFEKQDGYNQAKEEEEDK